MDESDRTLVRVARADVDEDEDPKVTSHKERHKRRSTEGKKQMRNPLNFIAFSSNLVGFGLGSTSIYLYLFI